MLEYAIRCVQGDQEDMELNGTHQRLVCADGVNFLGNNIHTIKNNKRSITYLLTPWCRVFLEKLTGLQLV